MQISQDVMAVIKEALASPSGSEVVIRGSNGVGRLYVAHQAVAWITCSTVNVRLRHILESWGNISTQAINEVVAECQKKGSNFAETLMHWGLIDRTTLHTCLLLHNAHHLQGIGSLIEPVQAIAIPQGREYAKDFLFTLEEISAAISSLDADLPADIPSNRMDELLTEARSHTEHCLALAVINLGSGSIAGVAHAQQVERAVLEGAVHKFISAWTHSCASQWASALQNAEQDTQHSQGLSQWITLGNGGSYVAIRSTLHPEQILLAFYDHHANLGRSIDMTRSALVAIGEDWHQKANA